ncbi:MAG: 3'-phosphoadenosine 5'-phosphosulfate sulfotransferase [Candelina submexicana]|nr:MAG: 3'-phosphoadenosine 5'-phosphosulfate sulfotransferase [Candelina submexicana]
MEELGKASVGGQLESMKSAVNGNYNSLQSKSTELSQRLLSFLNSEPATDQSRSVQNQVRISLGVIEEALDRYSLDELSISYNGGKDCLVLLILFLAALASRPIELPANIQSVYIVSRFPFIEIDTFVNESSEAYCLDLERYAKPMKVAFGDYIKEKPNVKAIFVGTRRTDPHGENLTFFDRTDHGWPDFMRIHPVIDWHYAEIWTFIRQLQIPYCQLYDLGYTSLGGTLDTHPNPALRAKVESSQESSIVFRPAYELVEDREERLGRDR